MTPNNTTSRIGRVLVNHLGFHPQASKQFVMAGSGSVDYEIQNMALNRPATMGGPEDFEAVLTGTTRETESAWAPIPWLTFPNSRRPESTGGTS